MTIAVDFDGTIVEHKYPAIGKEKPFAIETLKQLADEGNKLILWTSRDGELLQEALDFCHKRGLDFYGVNSNQPVGSLFEGRTGSTSVKVVADVYIDDKNLGGLPEWGTIYEMITGLREKKHKKRRKGLFGKLFR
ncbi:MAG: hypothetical protein IJJ96_10300 [Bacteroidales bacterium]|nr:hypothetical protein [Bacteroidales bacterium]